ncbi:hypothetical protein F4780DRAFT_780666 [Xylariomycetidae sp. FL0641]|nr:hypothetical protein F4780DRAFT_780666 [Xylariomycetidae sp. FL0641]
MAGSKKIMSLEAALEEERREIENLMASRQAGVRRGPSGGHRSPSPYTGAGPRSPAVKSMLDIGGGPPSPSLQSPVRSMLDIGASAPPRQPPRSMLDISAAATAPSSTNTSPTLSFKSPVLDNTARNRSMSDASSKPPFDQRVRSPPPNAPRGNDPTSAYRFSGILPTNVGQSFPVKRGSSTARPASMAEALRGADLSQLGLIGDSSRGFSLRKNKSKSPSSRFSGRSSSPFGNPYRRTQGNQAQSPLTLDDDPNFDMNHAYRRLSDANLIHGNSNLAPFARKKLDYSDGLGRLAKDNMSPYGELLPDESEDEVLNTSDEENDRGRKLTTRDATNKPAKSLLAALEDERKHVSSQPQYRSLFDDPEITITSPTGEKGKLSKSSKSAVQPSTSFDTEPISGVQTPLDPDLDADVTAIKVAQNLQLSMTPVINSPEVHRSIRIIYRGDYPKIHKDAEDEHRRLRKYLVATDLSDESTHALEWTVGTVLRDGDTMVAIYCMDEESSSSIDASNSVPDEPKAMKEQAAAINAMAKNPTGKTAGSNPGNTSPFPFNRSSSSPHIPHIRMAEAISAPGSPAPGSRSRTKTEEERNRAVQDITERVSKLLRKTQLQVRVIVEVIHCKNPKHLITEVIDLLTPTLVILGSRGRSALKGTLLGSFSNYLVTKSSVPVMVARKRLRKKSKYQPPPVKQVNNLANPSARSLEHARID